MTAALDAIRADKGALEYDEQNHALIFTERLSPDEYGASALVGHGVPPWMGNALIEAVAALDRTEAVVAAARRYERAVVARRPSMSQDMSLFRAIEDEQMAAGQALRDALRAYEDADKVADDG